MSEAVGFISGGRIENHDQGWGLVSYSASMEKAHYWFADGQTHCGQAKYFVSECGVISHTTDGFPMLEPGNFPKCKRCLKKRGE